MRIGRFEIARVRAPEQKTPGFTTTEEHFREFQSQGKRLILGTLAARSGTRWLCDIVNNHDRAYAVTERDTTVEAFWRYVKYNELPIDTDGIVKLLKQRIAGDWLEHDTTFVFSPYFSHGFQELCRALSPDKIVFAIARPEFVVQSIHNKGVFEGDYSHRNTDLALGYQPEFADQWSHFFGRIVPRGEFYQTWEGLTRIGKIAWWVNRVNMDIYTQLQEIPKEQVILFDLTQADQNYEYYLNLARVLNLSPLLAEERFLSLKKLTVKESDNVKHTWSEAERTEFDYHIEEWQRVYDVLASRTANP